MKIGYARVSTDEQSLEVQVEQLKRAGCERIYQEKRSGKLAAGRVELESLLKLLEGRMWVTWATSEGQGGRNRHPNFCGCGLCGGKDPAVVVVTKLDRLARNTRDLLEILERIGKAGASFVSLSEPWADTTSPAGKLIMTVFAGVAQFERERTAERASEGRKRAKANGVHLGRHAALSGEQLREARKMAETKPLKAVARIFEVHPSTLRRNLKRLA